MTAEEILAAAIERKTPAERVAYLDGACGNNAELRASINGLLKSHEQAGSFLEQSLFEAPSADIVAVNPLHEGSSIVIGPCFKLPEQSGDPNRNEHAVAVAEVVGGSLDGLQRKLADDSITKARMTQAIGESYLGLGLVRKSIPLFEEARDLFVGTFGREHFDTLDAMSRLAAAYHQSGRPDKAARLNEQVLKVRQEKLGPDHADTLATMTALAVNHSYDRSGQEIALFEEAFRLQKAKLGPEHSDTLRSMASLGLAYVNHDRRAEGLPILEAARKLQKATLGTDHDDTIRSTVHLACIYDELGRHAEAIAMLEKAVAFQKAKLGPDHTDTLRSKSELGRCYMFAARLREAVPMLEEVVSLQKAKLGPGHFDTYRSTGFLADACLRTGRTDEAISLLEDMREFTKSWPGLDTAWVTDNLAVAYGRKAEALMVQGKTAEAAAQFVLALDQSADGQKNRSHCHG